MPSRKSKVIALSFAQIINTIISVISGMVFARTLSVDDYATYLQTFIAYDFAVPLLTLGLPTTLYYFLPREENRQRTIVLEVMLLLFIAGMIFSLFLILGGTNLLAQRFSNPELKSSLKWLIIYPIYTFPVVTSIVLIIKNKFTVNIIYEVLVGLIFTTLLIVSCIFTGSYSAPLKIKILFPVFLFPIVIYLSFRFVPGRIGKPEIASMLKMLRFGIPLGLSSILGSLTIQLSNLIVSFFCSPSDFAIFANGSKELPIISIVTGSIATVIMTDMNSKCKEGDVAGALLVFRKAALLSSCFLFPIMVFLFVFSQEFIQLMYTSKYSESAVTFRIYLLVLPIRIVYYGSALMAFGNTKAILKRSIGDFIITIILSSIMVNYIGPNGALLAFILCLYLWSVPYNLLSLSHSFKCSPASILPLKNLLIILVIASLSALIALTTKMMNLNPISQFVLGGFIFLVVYSIITWIYIEDFRQLLRPLVIRFLHLKSWLINET